MYLQCTEHGSEDVELHSLLSDSFGLFDALSKVVQHLQSGKEINKTEVVSSIKTNR